MSIWNFIDNVSDAKKHRAFILAMMFGAFIAIVNIIRHA